MTDSRIVDLNVKRARRIEFWSLMGLSFPALLLVSIVVLVPTLWLFSLSVLDDQGNFSLINYQRMLEQSSYTTVFRTTFSLSLVVTVTAIIIGYPLAYLLSQLSRRMAGLLLLCVLLPFWTSLLVRTYAWLVLLQRKGLINTALINAGIIDQPLPLAHNFTAASIGMVHIMVPFLVLPLYASMRAIDRSYMRAAANLGASPVRAFWSVFFPLSVPGLLVGTALVFVLCLGFFVTPALLGGGKVIMIAMRIDMNLRLYNSWGAASALGVVLVVLTAAILLLMLRLAKAGGGLSVNR